MAHYAFLNDNNIVTQVIVGKNENEGVYDWEKYYGEIMNCKCVRTSYNTHGGIHTKGGIPFRKNYAGIGFVYDENLDAFIVPSPYPSWILNEDSCIYEAPLPHPNDASSDKFYAWNEELLNWEVIFEQPLSGSAQ